MFAAITRSRSILIVWFAVMLLVGQARAVDFEFLYDDPVGQGFFDPVQGPARRAALEAAGEIWGRLIRPTYEGEMIAVRSKFQMYPPGVTTLASAEPNFLYSDFGSSSSQYQSDTNYPKALANHLAGRDLAPERHEINVFVNVASSFYYGLDGMPPAGQRDFLTTAAHELGHGLGFYDSFRDDGDYGLLGDKTSHPFCLECLPTPYDRFLALGQLGSTLISLDSDARENALTSNNVFWNGTSGVAGNGGTAPKIAAPAIYSAASSISHLDQSMDSSMRMVMMAPAYAGVRQVVSAVERGIMRDMGWTISVASSQINWTGLGADNNASTAANWSPALPQPDDRLVFDQSPTTDVDMDLPLGTLQGISFPDTAPAYTLRFKSNVDTDLTGSGIINFSSNSQTIFLESSLDDAAVTGNTAAALTFKNTANAGNSDYHLRGGGTSIGGGPPPHIPHRFDRHAGASITFENNATAGTASFEIEGGAGNGGPNAQVTFRHNSTASVAEFRTKGGRLGPDLPLGNVIVGFGGGVRFEDNARAGLATFHNEGQTEYFDGAGGFTVFTDSSTAHNSEIHNHGATFTSASMNGIGGATFFYDTTTAGTSSITNHADGQNHIHSISARTVFEDSSNAGTATIENEAAPANQSSRPGRTEFRGNSSAASATIHTRGNPFFGGPAARTDFYDSATAANATIRIYEGYNDAGRVEFHNNSTAASARITLEDVVIPGGVGGAGNLAFRDDSTAAQAQITIQANACCNGIQFYDRTTAANAQLVTQNGAGNITFWGTSTAANANISLGQGTVMSFYDQSTAQDAIITVANGAQVQFNMNSSAGQAQIAAAGSNAYPVTGGAITFNSTSTVNNATILATGGTAPLAGGASVWFINGSHAGNATVIADGGANGGGGAVVTFNAGAKGDSARLVANAGATVDFFDQRLYGDTSVGSIEGAGTFVLRGSLLTTGVRNTSTTVTGQIIDHPTGFVTGGRLTKVGAGTLTLAGANVYSGLTTVAGGRLLVNGSIAGDALVASGATLGGVGTIGGTVTVNPGGILAPGASPGTITVGGLTMMPGGILDLELGDPGDQIIITGNGNIELDGILDISLADGFTPALGQSFTLFEGAIGSVTGAFDLIDAPIAGGLTFDVMQNASSVMLQVVESQYVAADFNRDGTVNGADLTNWRSGFGTPGATHTQGDADGDDDVDGGDFLVWQRQLGSGSGSVPASTAVPEPTTGILLAVGALSIFKAVRRRATQGAAAALWLALAAPAAADYAVQDNIAFNARKINPYTGGPAWELSDTKKLLDESFGPVTIGPLNADPLGLALETLFGVDLPHLVKLQTGASLSGDAKVEFGYYVTAGRLDISYPASANLNFQTAPGTTNIVQANQTYGVNGGFLPGVSQRTVLPQFLETQGGAGYATAPLRSQTEYQQPWFETTSPWASAWVEASANVQSSIFTKVSALGGLKEWRKDIRAGGNVGGRLVEIDPNGLYVAGEEVVGFDLTQPIGPIPIAGGAADLTIQVPNIAVSSVTNGNVQGAVIRARKQQPLVTLTGNLERLIPFVGTILQNQIGPLGYDLLNLAGGPQLSLYQEMTFTPDPKVRLSFSEPVLVGASNVPTFQAAFDLDEAINWKPMFSNSSSIQVTPTYLLNNTFKNETGLNIDLVVDVEALSLTGDFPPFNGTLGPVYEERITIPIFEGGKLFAPQFNIPLGSVTAGSVPGIGPITTGVITFQKSNLDIQVGLGDLELTTWNQGEQDPQNPDYFDYDLEFTRAVDGGPPREYQATARARALSITPEGGGGEEDFAAFLETVQDVIVTDPVTNEQFNLGRYFTVDGFDQSEFLPAPSPAYVDPNPSLGTLYVTTLPDDLSFVPNVDLNVTGHPTLDQYNAADDINPPQDSSLVEITEVIDRAQYPATTVVVRSGEVIPDGIGRFNSFNFVGALSMNDNGGVAFIPNLTVVPPGSGTTGYYFADDSSKVKLVRSGVPVPGGDGAFSSFPNPVTTLNNLGQAAFVANIANSSGTQGEFRAGPTALTLIARNGQTAPGGNGTFQGFGPPTLNNSGQVLFSSEVTPDDVLYLEVLCVSDGMALSEIAREGDAAPGLPGLMSGFGYYSLNDSGQVAFDMHTTGGVQGLYVRDGNNLQLIAYDGGDVPQGGEFVGINDHDLNNVGQVAFAAGLRTSSFGNLIYGIFRGDNTSLVQIARQGQLAPDGDGTLKENLFEFQMNDAGEVAFLGYVDALTDYRAVLLGDGVKLTQIARYGTPAPDGNGQITQLRGIPQINNHGHVAILAEVSTSQDAIVLYDGANLVQVVREGQPLAGSTISNIGFLSLDLNDDMQLAYHVSLADGRSLIARFEPSVYWRNAGSGNWATPANWSLRIEPINPYDVFIVAESALTVAGPLANRTVKSLSLGAADSASVTLNLANGVTLSTIKGATIRPNGIVTGSGTLAGSVVNEGTISPGSSPGTLSIDGNFSQSSAGKLVIEIASPVAYDQLLVSGDVTLGGTLAVSLLDGFVPTEGQQFSIFGDQFDSITGAFQSVEYPMFNGLTFAVSQTLNSIMLQVVEAPLPGDFNGDGSVTGADLANWTAGFGTPSGATPMQGDADADADVDGHDFLTWQRQLGSGPPLTPLYAAVPEPNSLLMLALAFMPVIAKRP